jgi:uncharacterized membrane protein
MVALANDMIDAQGDWLSVTLARSAPVCYDAFCDLERTPEWLTILCSAVVIDRDRHDRPLRVAYLCRLDRATIGYTLTYRYEPDERRIAWSTSPSSSIIVRGSAHFQELSARSCLMTYALDLTLPERMPQFEDKGFSYHAASAVIGDFRDFVVRKLP